MTARLIICLCVFAFALTARASEVASPRNGTVGVAHVIEMFERPDCGDERALIIVTTDEDFEDLTSRSQINASTPLWVKVLGTPHRLTLGREHQGHWISGRDTVTHQKVYLVAQRYAEDWH